MLSLEEKNGLGVSEMPMGCRRNCMNYSSWMDFQLPPNDRLPVKGKYFWNRKGNSLETLVSGKYLLILIPSQGFNLMN